jgi:hypothetical protein
LIKTEIYLCPRYRKSLQSSKENIQHFKKINLLTFFYVFWVIFALLDPDHESGYGSRDPIESGSKTLMISASLQTFSMP